MGFYLPPQAQYIEDDGPSHSALEELIHSTFGKWLPAKRAKSILERPLASGSSPNELYEGNEAYQHFAIDTLKRAKTDGVHYIQAAERLRFYNEKRSYEAL